MYTNIQFNVSVTKNKLTKLIVQNNGNAGGNRYITGSNS